MLPISTVYFRERSCNKQEYLEKIVETDVSIVSLNIETKLHYNDGTHRTSDKVMDAVKGKSPT